MWREDKVCIHYPDRLEGVTEKDNDSLDPEDYPRKGKTYSTMKKFRKLADEGGYIWAERRRDGRAKVGLIEPQKIHRSSATWTTSEEFAYRSGTEAILKTLSISNSRTVEPHELVGLKAARPRQGTICNWNSVGDRLADVVEGRKSQRVWGNLSTAQQEAVCAEYLRFREGAHPRLRFLLLPVGRTLKDIDVYGANADGQELFGQVTFHSRKTKEFGEKLETLESYRGKDTSLIFFGRDVEYGEQDGVFFVPVNESANSVESWMNSTSGYPDLLFS